MIAPINVIIYEQNAGYLKKIVGCLDRHPDINCMAAFSDCQELMSFVHRCYSDICCLDYPLSPNYDINIIKDIEQLQPSASSLMYTHDANEQTILKAFKAGAGGYILKNGSLLDLPRAIRELKAGRFPVSPLIAKKLRDFFQRIDPPEINHYDLSIRERQVMSCLIKGASYQQAAAQLFISRETVKKHVINIYKKLGVNNKVSAINKFLGRYDFH